LLLIAERRTMRIGLPWQAALHTAVLAASVGLMAACTGTTVSGRPPWPAVTRTGMADQSLPGMSMSGQQMPGMNTAESIPGMGLLGTASGLTLRPLTNSVRAGQASPYRFRIIQAGGTPLTSYQAGQTKLLHFYLIRDDLTGFEHLHPALAPDGTWTVTIRPADAGSYRVFTQFTGRPAGQAVSLVLSRPLTVTGLASPPMALPAPAATTRADGYTLAITGSPRAGTSARLTVTVTRNGKPVTDLQPYLGTYAHLTAFHQGDLAFAHLHPSGAVNGDHGGPTLHFDAVLPEPGSYRLFLQFQAGGRLRTAQVTVPVS
jgi:hypothetical protein